MSLSLSLSLWCSGQPAALLSSSACLSWKGLHDVSAQLINKLSVTLPPPSSIWQFTCLFDKLPLFSSGVDVMVVSCFGHRLQDMYSKAAGWLCFLCYWFIYIFFLRHEPFSGRCDCKLRNKKIKEKKLTISKVQRIHHCEILTIKLVPLNSLKVYKKFVSLRGTRQTEGALLLIHQLSVRLLVITPSFIRICVTEIST